MSRVVSRGVSEVRRLPAGVVTYAKSAALGSKLIFKCGKTIAIKYNVKPDLAVQVSSPSTHMNGYCGDNTLVALEALDTAFLGLEQAFRKVPATPSEMSASVPEEGPSLPGCHVEYTYV